MWVISNRLMKDRKQSILQYEGISGLWKGLTASFLLVSNPVINFVLYELLKDRLLSKSVKPSTVSYFLLAAISKAIATFVTYPILTVRTRQQLS